MKEELVVEVRRDGTRRSRREIEVIGVSTCGGCPGKKAVTRAAEMVKLGADTIVLASCSTKGHPIGFVCPHAQEMINAITKRLGGTV